MKGVLLAAAIVASTAVSIPSAVATTATDATSVAGTGIDPGHSSSWPTAIDDANEVVGGHSVGNDTHGFVWRAGTVTDLGTLDGGDYSLAEAINRYGDIVGDSGTYSIPGRIHAVLWHGGTMQDLGSLGGNSFANAINGNGVIVGSSELQPSGAQFRAVMWQQGVMTVLPTLSGSYYDTANLLDDQGDAAGYSVLTSGVEHAVLWTNGTIQDLGPGHAVALNGLGQVLVQGVDAQGHTYPFIWDHGKTITFPATVTTATALNDNGQVVGTYVPTGTTQQHGFLWQAGTITDLGTLSPVDVNDNGQVLASSSTTYGLAFGWDRGTVTQLLPVSGAVAMPTVINATGFVAGTSGQDTATVWQLP